MIVFAILIFLHGSTFKYVIICKQVYFLGYEILMFPGMIQDLTTNKRKSVVLKSLKINHVMHLDVDLDL